MNERVTLGEIFNKIAEQEDETTKIEVLLKYHKRYSKYIECMLRLNFDDNFVCSLPKGKTPYTPYTGAVGYTTLFKECPKLHRFMKGSNTRLAQYRREQIWIQLLESLDATEAQLLEHCMRKTYTDIDRATVVVALPNLLPELLVEEVEEPEEELVIKEEVEEPEEELVIKEEEVVKPKPKPRAKPKPRKRPKRKRAATKTK